MSDRWTDKKRSFIGGVPSVAQSMTFNSDQRERLGGLDFLRTTRFDADGNEHNLTRFGKYERGQSTSKKEEEKEIKECVVFVAYDNDTPHAVFVWDPTRRKPLVRFGLTGEPCLPDNAKFVAWYNTRIKTSKELLNEGQSCGRDVSRTGTYTFLAPHLTKIEYVPEKYYFIFPTGFTQQQDAVWEEEIDAGCPDLCTEKDYARNGDDIKLRYFMALIGVYIDVDVEFEAHSSKATVSLYPQTTKYELAISNPTVQYIGVRTRREFKSSTLYSISGEGDKWTHDWTLDYERNNETTDIFYSPWGAMDTFVGRHKYMADVWDRYVNAGDLDIRLLENIETEFIPCWQANPGYPFVEGEPLYSSSPLRILNMPLLNTDYAGNSRITTAQEAYVYNRDWISQGLAGCYSLQTSAIVCFLQYTPFTGQAGPMGYHIRPPGPPYSIEYFDGPNAYTIGERKIIVHAQAFYSMFGLSKKNLVRTDGRENELEEKLVEMIELAYTQIGLGEQEISSNLRIGVEILRQ